MWIPVIILYVIGYIPFKTGADLGFFTHQSNAEVVSHARGVRGHALPGKF